MGTTIAIITLSLLLIAVANLSIGLVVLLSGLGSAQRRWFVLATGGSTIWVLTNALFPHASGVGQFWAALFSYSAAALVALSVVGLCLEMAAVKVNTTLKTTYFAIGALIVVGSAIPNVISTGIAEDSSIETRAIALTIYGFFVLCSLLLGFGLLVVGSRAAKKDERARMKLVLFGLLGAIATGATFNLLLPLANNYSYTQLGPGGTIFFIAASALAMARYKLMDVRAVAVRTVTYILSVATLAFIYFMLAYLASLAIFGGDITTAVSMSPINVVLALILAFIFQPVKRFFDQITDRVFYRNRYDTGDFLIRVGRILTSTTELQDILSKVGQEICQTLKANGSLFLVFRDDGPDELVGEGVDREFSEEELAVLASISGATKGGLLIVDRLGVSGAPDNKKLRTLLSKRHISLVLPLISADRTIGYFMLGEHMSGVYGQQDTEALEAIANELVIAVQNARSVQALRDLNANLEQRIVDATKELRKNNDQLRQADEAKDEFVSMASHQLRTPLTSIKGYISMVLEGDAGEITPMQKKLLEEAFTSSERMVHLIGDFLNVSRLQTGKFVLDPRLTDLADLVEEEVDGLKETAKARLLKLEYRKPSLMPSLYIDDGKIHQVIMNFLDNAIYYSMEHTTITVRLAVEGSDVVFEVHDTGIGVPKKEQVRLFTKFFRATNARKQRPDGTGIGLFLAKKVILSHGGTMVFESAEGKGSTFGFRLPIKKLSEPPREK